ncbi:MAG: ABC transporter ATP-binding protein/permease [Lachnospiraceae bacterium]|nr:ABC transporter ATP-binding protein/permease [Lachnospiraceae bacterium]
MKRFSKYIKPHLLYFILTPLFMCVEVVGEVYLPRLLAEIINIGVINDDRGFVIRTGLKMCLIIVFTMAGGVLGSYFSAKASTGFGNDLRLDAFKKVQSFSFKNIDNFSTGSLVTRLTNDITQLQNITNMGLKMLLRAPGMLIASLFMAIQMNASLAVILAVIVPVLALTIGFLIKKTFPMFGIMQKKLDKLNNNVQENLTNIRVVKSFVREEYENKKFCDSTQDLYNSSVGAFLIVILTMPVMTLSMNVATIAVVWFGGKQVLEGTMPVGDLSAFAGYIVQVLGALMMTAMILLNSSRAIASGKRIIEVLDTEPDINDDAVENRELVVKEGAISFKNVCFKYYKNHDNYVLNHINLDITPGETVGIIGGTGSGKTSLVQLIPRLYDVDEGEVLIDGTDVRKYSIKNLRDSIGMVLQKNVLFSGTVKSNLLWGDMEASDEEIRKYAAYAQADHFINSFTKGYDSELGQGGVNVSGGQKQRLCIARALLKKPKILILDDSTSAVDTATEAAIRKAFAEELKDTTKLIIAQRISSIKAADRIVVIDDGTIVGVGTHDELYANNPTYREICISQEERRAE